MTTAAYQKSYYWKNREKVLQQSRERNARKRKILNVMKAFIGCERCGNDDPRVLDFHHHENNKELNIANHIGGKGLATLVEEAMKCSVLCANCHRIAHAENGYFFLEGKND